MAKKPTQQIPVKTARELWTENGAGKVPSLKDHVDALIAGNKPKDVKVK